MPSIIAWMPLSTSTMCSMFSATDQMSWAGLKSHCAGERPPTDSSKKPRVTDR